MQLRVLIRGSSILLWVCVSPSSKPYDLLFAWYSSSVSFIIGMTFKRLFLISGRSRRPVQGNVSWEWCLCWICLCAKRGNWSRARRSQSGANLFRQCNSPISFEGKYAWRNCGFACQVRILIKTDCLNKWESDIKWGSDMTDPIFKLLQNMG